MQKELLDIRVSDDLRLLISPHSKDALCFDVVDAVDYGESRWQLQEGREYEYELVNALDESAAKFHLQEKSGIVIPRRHKNEGSLKTGIYVGTLSLIVENEEYKQIGEPIRIEIQSVKTSYRSDYRKMLNDITGYYTDLVMLQGSPVTQKFEVDNDASSQTLYQKFAFVKSIVDSETFEDAVHKIVQSPVRKWTETTVVKHVENVRRLNRSGLRQIANRTDRIACDGLVGLNTLPRKLEVPYKCDTVNTIENQFVKYVLCQFYGFCSEIMGKKNASDQLKNEAGAVSNILLKYIAAPFFKEIDMPQHINLNSPVLQRKEGYREILQGWLIFDLAAKLNWDGGDNVYEAGKKNVAALYEYWLFFKLLEIVGELFHIKPEDKSNLVTHDADNLNLDIKQGRMKMICGTSDLGGRKLNVGFYYNRTFGHRENMHVAGSWTMPMRPDYTLSMWPGNISEEEAEKEEVIVHIHFDAKYRVNQISLKDEDTSIAEIDDENSSLNKEFEREKDLEESGDYQIGMYKRADILKMHAYKDAIRRTSGAYILYPGTEHNRKKGFHEVIPGLGAFCISPGDERSQIADLKRFLIEVKDHMLDRASQREKMALQSYSIYRNVPQSTGKVCEPLPESVGEYRAFQPDDTYVLLGYYKSQEHLDWILKNMVYNARAGKRRGSLNINEQIVRAKYLLLHNAKLGCRLLKIVADGPKVYESQDLANMQYPFSGNAPVQDRSYLMFSLMSEIENEFSRYEWTNADILSLCKGKSKFEPRTVTLSELIRVKK